MTTIPDDEDPNQLSLWDGDYFEYEDDGFEDEDFEEDDDDGDLAS